MAFFLYDKASGRKLFEITLAQRDQLIGALEEEHAADRDYYIDRSVCDYLEGRLDAQVIGRLRELLGPSAVAAAPDGLEAATDDDELPPVEGEEQGLDIEWREE
jgi:hypothetical protein